MALSDYAANVRFYHTFDAAQENLPGTLTVGTAGSYTAPTIASGYADFGNAHIMTFTGTGTPLMDVGTGDFTLLVCATIDTAQQFDSLMNFWSGAGATGLHIRVSSAASKRIEMCDPDNPTFRSLTTNGYTEGQQFIVAFRRSGGTHTAWMALNSASTTAMASETLNADYFGTRDVDEADNCYIGARYDGAENGLDGRIYWAAAIAAAVSDADLGADQWSEANMTAAWIGGGASVAITDAGDESFQDGEIGIVITGTGFGASQGAGTVLISPTDDVEDVTAVAQTVTAWADTSITITAAMGALAFGATAYLFVVEDGGVSNAAGRAVSFATRGPQRRMLLGIG